MFYYIHSHVLLFLSFSYGYAFLVSAEIGGDVKKMFDSIEDIIAQADEVDEKYLQVNMVIPS